MNKKLLSLFLAIMMAMSCMLAGCSSTGSEDETVEATADTEESSRISMTLTLWIPTSEDTTEEAILAVQDAINDLTQPKFDTAIELHAVPEDEYQEAIDARMAEIAAKKEEEALAEEAAREAAKALKDAEGEAAEETAEESESEEGEETYVNDLGITVIKYPEVEDTQMDIFLVQGYDNYMRYIEEGAIQQLDSELSSTSKILKTYIYPKFLEVAKQGGTYAIPNNRPIGEYQFLLINKALCEEYDHDWEEMTALGKCEEFIKDIAYQNLDGVVPLLDNYDNANINYVSSDGSWSILASVLTNAMDYNTKVVTKSVISTPLVLNHMLMMKRLQEVGAVGDGTLEEGEIFAVGIVEGDLSVLEQYEDEYYSYIHAKPLGDEEDMFGNMFAVSTYSKSLARSMEILTYLNTDTELRTVLQYGAEGIHWQIDPDNEDTIISLSDDYKMDLYATGNVYMTYPDYGKTLADWDYAKKQNLDAGVSPLMLFDGYVTEENAEMVAELDEFSKQLKAEIDAMTAAEFKSAITGIKKDIKNNEAFTAATDVTSEDAVGPCAVYEAFYSETFG